MMKDLRISLSEATIAALEAEVAAGEAGSISELIEAALEAYLDPALPTPEEMVALALEAEADANATGKWYTADEVRRFLREGED